MNKKLWYLIPLALVIVGLLLPAFLNNKPGQSPPDQASVSQNSNSAGQPTAADSAGEGRAAEPASSAAGELNNEEDSGLSTETNRPGTTRETSAAAPSPGTAGQPENGASTAPAPAPEPAASATASPAGAADGNPVTCQLAVVGKGGELLFGPAPVKLSSSGTRGPTALSVLAATGLPYNVSQRWPDFVESIAGQRNQGQSGWLYQVNGAVPPVAAGKKTVAAEDKIIWWYSGSISDPPPVWGQLADQAAGSR
ncbi:MAG: hypothetical protein A4E53_03899 [Pelotomaculum sp. PtaB.Bin104]|nr:MAG: hypothetical protein A4E53_03899 [Pelotomaculum sp. PtaB.Bin104]